MNPVLSDATAEAVEGVVLPFVRRMGNLWESGEVTMVYEHFASEMVRGVLLSRLMALLPPPQGAPTVVIACPALERHDLGNVALWLALTEQEVNVVYLGVDVPTTELIAACRELRPDALCLAATATTSLPTVGLAVRALIDAKTPGLVFVGGPAFRAERDDRPIPGIHLPSSLTDAARYIANEVKTAAR